MSNAKLDPIIQRIITLLEKNGPPELRQKYVYGRIYYDPNRKDLPLVSIGNGRERLGRRKTRGSEHDIELAVSVITAWTHDLSRGWNVEKGFATLKQLVGARQADYNFTDTCIMGVLDANKRLEADKNLYILNDIEADYRDRPNIRGRNVYTVEATVSFTVRLEATSKDA